MISFLIIKLIKIFNIPHNCIYCCEEVHQEITENEFITLHKCKVCGRVL